MKFIKNLSYMAKRYAFMVEQLVLRDFKVKYKRSVLGVTWSLLYPLLTMAVMAVVFSNMFRFTSPGVNYLAYLITGLTFFNFYADATNQAMGSVINNFSLINKVYMPKYIFPFTKCLSSGINFLLTLVPMYLVVIFTRTGLNWYHFILPYDYLCFFMFIVGMSLILSTAVVFLRDVIYLYGVIITLWNYVTPVFWDISMMDSHPFLVQIFKLNPLYQYINFARTIILHHQCPSMTEFAACAAWGLGILIIGIVIFRKNQDKFIYYA